MRILIFLLGLIVSNYLCAQSAVDHNPPSKVVLDIAYVPGGVAKQKLDLYTPARNGFPLIMFIHGGGLTVGDRKNEPAGLPNDAIAKRFQADGIGFAVISYRLGPENKWPAQPDDCVAAFDWLKKNIWSYGGNPKRIFVMGHSSGAFLTYMLAFDPKYLDKKGYTQKDIAGALPMGAKLEHLIKLPEGKTETDWQKIIKEKNQATDLTFGTLAIFNDANPIIYLNREIPPT